MALLLWLASIAVMWWVTFVSGWLALHHFWHRWEFFSATCAAAYNVLVFPVMFYGASQGGETLDATLPRGGRKLLVFWFRFLFPPLLLCLVAALLLADGAAEGPSPSLHVLARLCLTCGVFVSFLIGDTLILTALSNPGATTAPLWTRQAEGWRARVGNHIAYVDLPFAISFVILVRIYQSTSHPGAPESELQLQAFLGGAAALEVLVQSAIHAFGTVSE